MPKVNCNFKLIKVLCEYLWRGVNISVCVEKRIVKI